MDFKFFGKAIYYFFKGEIGESGVYMVRSLGCRCPEEHYNSFFAFNGHEVISKNIQLNNLPEGSMGKMYINFLRDNNKKEMIISDFLATHHSGHKLFGNRLILIHDLLHFLLDFSFTFEGEIKLNTVQYAQNKQMVMKCTLYNLIILCLLIRPWEFNKIFAAKKQGEIIAKKLPYLCNIDFTPYWHLPLEEVKEKLGLRYR
ncbi:MAG: Coq4 family protein [Chitinophagaceae bacterium]